MSDDAPLLSVEGLRIERDPPGGDPLVASLTFTLAAGERLGIVGESGSGKTLATRAVPRLLAPGLKITAGRIRLDGRDLGEAGEGELRSVRGAGVGLVFQEPMTSLNPAIKVGEQLAEGLRLHSDLDDKEIRRRSIAMLERVRIADPAGCLDRYPHEFSGGMRQRIMLASVLLLEPRLLIADEPTTALDTLSQREVLEIMRELTAELGTGLLLITHDLGVVARYTERVLVMEKGVLVEQGPTDHVLADPQHPYTKRLVAALPRRAEGRAAVPAAAARTPLLEIRSLSVDYPGKPGLIGSGPPRRVLDSVDLKVAQGEIVALVGASGSGKTTLGRAALDLIPASGGEILFDGVRLAEMDRGQRRQFRREAQLVFQDPFSSLDPKIRIAEIVGATLRHLPDLSRAERRAKVAAALEAVGLSGFADRFPHQMSGGQRQRVAIARAIVSEPRLVVADEPVSALDLTIQRQVLDLLQGLQKERGFACLFITHDLAVVDQVADRVVVLEGGRVVEEGPASAVLDAPKHEYTRRLLEATPALALASGTMPA
jgi:peptide/nickel transport system ATP-binding protein